MFFLGFQVGSAFKHSNTCFEAQRGQNCFLTKPNSSSKRFYAISCHQVIFLCAQTSFFAKLCKMNELKTHHVCINGFFYAHFEVSQKKLMETAKFIIASSISHEMFCCTLDLAFSKRVHAEEEMERLWSSKF